MSPSQDWDEIQKRRLFVGSGVESFIDSKIATKLDEYGQYCPVGDGVSAEVERVLLNSQASCNESKLAKKNFSKINNIQHSSIIGYFLGLYVGHVTVGDYRKKGSSGGMVSWFATSLLETGKIDGLIHVKKTHKKDVLFKYGISRTASEIQSGAKSRYYPAELSCVLDEARKIPGKYAVVAIPEIITELRLLAEEEPIMKERIKYYIGLVCGHQKTTKYAEAIAWEYGIQPGQLTDIDFRVKKETGNALEYDMKFTGIVNEKKKTYIVRNNEPFVSSWAHGFFKARFSDFTDNAFNENADITFGDAWLDEYMNDPGGNNIVIIRNPELKKLFTKAASQKEIVLDKVSEETIIRSQQGLIHHTRDELPYRLYKEIRDTGWAPDKRVKPNSHLSDHRKQVQDIRQQIAEKSHKYYRQAVQKNDFEYFKKKMQPLVDQYKRLYNEPIENPHSKVKADGAIVTLTGYFNYGNILQRYALQEFLRKHGYNFVSYVNEFSGNRAQYKIGKKRLIKTPLRAAKRFLRQQKPYWYIPKYNELYPEAYAWHNTITFVNKYIKTKPFDARDKYNCYIVGSDQVWRDWWNNREILGHFFLNFLKGRFTRRVAYAASFGNEKIQDAINSKDIEYLQPYLDNFDAVSVREKSGVSIIRKAWKRRDVEVVLDPTLLL